MGLKHEAPLTPLDKPITVGGLMGRTFKLYRQMFTYWFTVTACVLIPFLILEAVFGYRASAVLGQLLSLANSTSTAKLTTAISQNGPLTMLLVMSLISVFIVSPLIYGTILYRIQQHDQQNRTAPLDEAFSFAARRLLPVGITNLVWWVTLGVLFGVVSSLLSFVLQFMGRPGVFIGVVLYLALFCAMVWLVIRTSLSSSSAFVEEQITYAAVRRSLQLTSHRFWRTFGFFVLLSLIVFGALIVISGIVGLVGSVILSSIITGLVNLFAIPLQSIGRAVLFLDYVREKDVRP